ncbi:MAG: hypothetical protein WC608_00545 [Parcubacteria group bacterium]
MNFQFNNLQKIFIFTIIFCGFFGLAKTTSAEKFFHQDNTWYMGIPNNPVLATTSSNVVSFMNGVYSGNLNSYNPNVDDSWSVPVWYANVEDPLVSIFQNRCHPSIAGTQCNIIPLPPEARPARNDYRCTGSYTDGDMVIINKEKTYAWDFTQTAYCEVQGDGAGDNDNLCEAGENCEWRFGTNGIVRRWDLANDDGVNQPNDGIWSARVSRQPLLNGLVTYKEVVVDGVINHAVAMYAPQKYPTIAMAQELYKGRNGWYPAWPPSEYTADYPNVYGPQLGMRFRLDQSFNCEALSTDFRKIVCRAMKEYGMIFVENTDQNGGYGIYLENLHYDGSRTWNGIAISLGYSITSFDVVQPVCADPYWCPDNLVSSADTTPPAAPQGLTVQ